MKIEDVTGVAVKNDIQIQKSCKAILIISTAGAIAAGVLATLKRVGKRGEKILYNAVPVLDLAEIMSVGEGLYVKETLAAAAAYPYTLPIAAARSIVTIPVTSGAGAAQFDENEYLSLDLEGLTAGTTYSIYCLEDLDDEDTLHFIEKLAVGAPRNSQDFPAAGFEYLALPKTNFDKIQIFGVNGKDVTLTYAELVVMSMMENDAVAIVGRSVATTPVVNIPDTIVGVDNLFVLSLAGVARVQIYCTGAAGYTFYRGRYSAE